MTEIDWNPEAAERLAHLVSAVGGAEAAARIAGQSEETLSSWRQRHSRWDCWSIARLCRAADRTIDWLVHGDGGATAGLLPERSVETAAEFVIRATCDFPDLRPVDVARSIVRRARELHEESALTRE